MPVRTFRRCPASRDGDVPISGRTPNLGGTPIPGERLVGRPPTQPLRNSVAAELAPGTVTFVGDAELVLQDLRGELQRRGLADGDIVVTVRRPA